MNIFKRIAKTLGKAAKKVGKAAPALIMEGLNAQSYGILEMVADTLGIGSKDPKVIEKHLQQADPEAYIELLIAKEETEQERIKGMVAEANKARDMHIAAIKRDSSLAWWMPLYTLTMLAILVWMFYELLHMPTEKNSETAVMLVGVVTTVCVQLSKFWTGQADVQQEKDNALRENIL